jgi:branched-chain amino acid transport system permease protein
VTAYLIAGLVLGGVYALVASGLVVTYASSGILNFAFGSMAYFIAKLYYFLHTQHAWSTAVAVFFCLVIVAPVLGATMWAVLFRSLQDSTTLAKIVATIGLSVAIPAVAVIAFGNDPSGIVVGVSPQPVPVYHIFGTAVTLDQVIVLVCVALIGMAGWWVMRFTDTGLVLRAMVSSRALTKATGTNPAPYSIGVWVSTTFIAGLTGILIAPVTGLTSGAFTLLMASAFAAVIAARFRYVGRAVLAALLLGVVGGVIQRYVPPQSIWSTAATSSVPFAVIVGFLIYYIPRGQAAESAGVGSALDAAIAVRGSDGPGTGAVKAKNVEPSSGVAADVGLARQRRSSANLIPMGVACVALVLFSVLAGSYWVGAVGSGVTFAIAFLSYTLITGEAGVISLCQITFAGIGAVATAELATNAHWPMPLALLGAGLIVVPVAGLLGYLTTRLGDLYIALVTLTFGLLMDNLVFTLKSFSNFGVGVSISRPSAILGDEAFLYVAFAIFIVFAGLIVLIRRGTYGMAIVSVRSSERGARSMGLNSAATKVGAMCIGGFIAGVGGGMMALYAGAAAPENFATLFGFVWLAVVVTIGVRSVLGALVAGISFTVLPAIFTTYLSQTWAQVPTVMFGLGAIFIARNPDGVVATHARQLGALQARLRSKPSLLAADTAHSQSQVRRLDQAGATEQATVSVTGHAE